MKMKIYDFEIALLLVSFTFTTVLITRKRQTVSWCRLFVPLVANLFLDWSVIYYLYGSRRLCFVVLLYVDLFRCFSVCRHAS